MRAHAVAVAALIALGAAAPGRGDEPTHARTVERAIERGAAALGSLHPGTDLGRIVHRSSVGHRTDRSETPSGCGLRAGGNGFLVGLPGFAEM